MHHIYFLWSKKLNKIYIGETRSVLDRLNYHNKGFQRYTKCGKPWELIGFVNFKDRKEALIEERRLKKCKNKSYYKYYLLKNGSNYKKVAQPVSPDQIGI